MKIGKIIVYAAIIVALVMVCTRCKKCNKSKDNAEKTTEARQ